MNFYFNFGFGRDPNSTLFIWIPRDTYQRWFWVASPEKLDEIPFLDDNGTQKYIDLILEFLHWFVLISKCNVWTVLLITFSWIRAQRRRQGHQDRPKRIYGYLQRFLDFRIKFRDGPQLYSNATLSRVLLGFNTLLYLGRAQKLFVNGTLNEKPKPTNGDC